MSTSKPKPPDNPETLQPFDRFDPIPQPDVAEGGESMWALWNEAQIEKPAPEPEPEPEAPPVPAPAKATAPPAIAKPAAAPIVPRAAVPPRPAATPIAPPVPVAPVASAPPPRRPRPTRQEIDKLVEESRRNKRVCPVPAKWQELHTMLRACAPADADPLPLPPSKAQWAKSTGLAKRLMIRDMIDWAAEYRLVEPMMQFVRALPEDQWHHMDE